MKNNHRAYLSRYMSKLGKKGGRARTKKLSAKRRREISRLGGLAKGRNYAAKNKEKNHV